MRRHALVLVAFFAAACGRPAPSLDLSPPDDAPPPAATCAAGVCLDGATAAHLEETRLALAACTANPDAAEDPGASLRIARIETGADPSTGEPLLLITMADVGPRDVMTYPGIAAEVVRGGALLAGTHAADNTLYGIFACTEMQVPLPLAWNPDDEGGDATISASVTNELGDVELDAAVFTLRRAVP